MLSPRQILGRLYLSGLLIAGRIDPVRIENDSEDEDDDGTEPAPEPPPRRTGLDWHCEPNWRVTSWSGGNATPSYRDPDLDV